MIQVSALTQLHGGDLSWPGAGLTVNGQSHVLVFAPQIVHRVGSPLTQTLAVHCDSQQDTSRAL